MHIAFLSNPASGQVNVQLTTAQQLLVQGHRTTFLSAQSCSDRIERFQAAQAACHQHLIQFVSLGSGHTVNDFTSFIQTRMHLMRRVPGDPVSLETCIEAALGPADEHAATALSVRDHVNALDPDMICVDALTPSLITGARLTKRKFILTIPCSPGLTALPGAFQPHLVAANRKGSWGTFFENLYLNTHDLIHSLTNPDRRAKRAIIKKLGLKSYGRSADSALLPPHWEDENCIAGIHFNTPGLIDCPKQSDKIVFVGAGVPGGALGVGMPIPSTPAPVLGEAEAAAESEAEAEIGSTDIMSDKEWFPELGFMDEASIHGADVVYINMGSMFVWENDEFAECIAGFKAAYKELDGRVRFLVKINARPGHSTPSSNLPKEATTTTTATPSSTSASTDSSITLTTSKDPRVQSSLGTSLPPYIYLTTWISNQTSIYTHPSLSLFIHHGGGNSFNEGVHFGIPQLVLSQWLDTHEYAFYAEKFGLGLKGATPPWITAADVREKVVVLLRERREEVRETCRAWALRSEIAGGVGAAARVVLFYADKGGRRAGRVTNELTPPLSPVLGEKT